MKQKAMIWSTKTLKQTVKFSFKKHKMVKHLPYEVFARNNFSINVNVPCPCPFLGYVEQRYDENPVIGHVLNQ